MTVLLVILWLGALIMIPISFFAPRFTTNGLVKNGNIASIVYTGLMIFLFFAVGLSVPVSPEAQLANQNAEKITIGQTGERLVQRVLDAEQTSTTSAGPIATPTSTPSANPSKTPRPTITPKPSATPRPTRTPRPTPTAKPTATPKSTATPKPTPTPPSVVVIDEESSKVIQHKKCEDFATQADAQKYFESEGGSASYNADGLDSDGNGKACENLK